MNTTIIVLGPLGRTTISKKIIKRERKNLVVSD